MLFFENKLEHFLHLVSSDVCMSQNSPTALHRFVVGGFIGNVETWKAFSNAALLAFERSLLQDINFDELIGIFM